MRVKYSILAMAVLAAVCTFPATQAATTEEIKTSISTQEGIDNLNLSATGDKTLSATDKPVFLFKNQSDIINISGQGSLTLSVSGSINGNAIVRFDGSSGANFTGFDSLTFKSDDSYNTKTYGFILGKQTKFGSEEQQLKELVFDDISLVNWKTDDTAKVDAWTKSFSTNQTMVVNGFDLTLHDGLEKANFDKGLNVVTDNKVTIEGGELTIGTIPDTKNSINIAANLKNNEVELGTESSKIISLVTSGGINIGQCSKLQVAASGQVDAEGKPLSTVGGNIFVGSDGALNWLSGSVDVQGNVRGEGYVAFGSESSTLDKLVITGTDPSTNNTYPNGVLFRQGGYIAAKDFELKGAFSVGTGNNTDGKNEVTVRGENASFTAHSGNSIAIAVNSGSSLDIQETESLTVNGSTSGSSWAINLNNGTLSAQSANIAINGIVGVAHSGDLTLGSADGAATGSITITANNSDEVKNLLSAGTGSSVKLAAGQVKLEAGGIDDEHRAISVSADSELELTATQAEVSGSVLNTGTMKMTTSGAASSLYIQGYVKNESSGTMSLTAENGTIRIETPNDASYKYYSGLHSNGQTTVAAQNFILDGNLRVSGQDSSTNIKAVATSLNGQGRAIELANGGQLTFEDTGDDNQVLYIGSAGVMASNGDSLTGTNNSKLTVEAGAVVSEGVIQSNGADINFGTSGSRLTNVSFSNNTDAQVLRSNGGDINVYAENVNIQNQSGAALAAFTLQREGEGDTGQMTINATESLTIVGDISAGSSNSENSSITIASAGITQVEGDIRTYNGDEYTVSGSTESGSTHNVINFELTGNQSWFKGNVIDEGASVESGTGTNLSLSDAAVWENTGNSTLTSLAMDDGQVDAREGNVTTESFEGKGQVILGAEIADDGTISSTKFTSTKAEDGSHIEAYYDGITSDEVLGQKLDGVSGVGATSIVEQGDIYGDYIQETDDEGNVISTRYEANTKLEGFKGVSAASLVQWRNQINHLTKRLGDVRAQSGEVGAWARVYGGEYKWGDVNHVEMTSTTVQIGTDGRVGDWIVGGAFSYTDSSFDLDEGSADGELFSAAVYGSRLFENGIYLDLVGRWGYIKNDVTVDNMDVDTNSLAFGLSGEIGYQFQIIESAYIEPQLEVTYGYVQGDDASASNGVKFEQDDYQSLVTRVGLRGGVNFLDDAATLYAHISYSYDFLGDAEAEATKGNAVPVNLDEDLGDGCFSYGVGGQFRVGASSFVYGEFERSTDGEVENPWAFNLGFRSLF